MICVCLSGSVDVGELLCGCGMEGGGVGEGWWWGLVGGLVYSLGYCLGG